MLVEPGITQIGRCALNLDGWSDRSVWGWDSQAGSLFAQLWRDGADDHEDEDGAPEIWITPPSWQATAEPIVLARRVAESTGSPVAVVLEAMARSIHGQSGDPLIAQVQGQLGHARADQ